jgi:serine/threonine protein kinase
MEWCAPELLESMEPKFTFKSDIYAMGMIMYEIAAERRPFSGVTITRVVESILQGKALLSNYYQVKRGSSAMHCLLV